MKIYRKTKPIFPIMLCLTILFSCTMAEHGKVIIYPAPDGESASGDFTLKVNGQDVFVYQARVSAWPINQVWPGYQRPMDQTELASFSYFDNSGKVRVELESVVEFSSVQIRPLSYGIVPEVEGNTIRFEMPGPGHVVVELDDYHNAFHLFASPLETEKPDPDDPKVHYYGPGIHKAGILSLKSDETVYIEGGAIVHGLIEARDASNIRIAGRGILDASQIGRFEGPYMISLHNCDDAKVDGIILRDPHRWTLVPERCRNVEISNVKLIGLWRYNTDGIDIVNSQDVLIRDCFIRAFDDNIVLKGLLRRDDTVKGPDVKNIRVQNCVLWNDWGKPLKIGTETKADSITRIFIEDCDIVHFVHCAMKFYNGARAVISHVTFNDIRIEEPITDKASIAETIYDPENLGRLVDLEVQQKREADKIRGSIEHIRYSNINYLGSNYPTCLMRGYDEAHSIDDIHFENIIIHGKKIQDLDDLLIDRNEFVSAVEIE